MTLLNNGSLLVFGGVEGDVDHVDPTRPALDPLSVLQSYELIPAPTLPADCN
jgi:hypothetical protein